MIEIISLVLIYLTGALAAVYAIGRFDLLGDPFDHDANFNTYVCGIFWPLSLPIIFLIVVFKKVLHLAYKKNGKR